MACVVVVTEVVAVVLVLVVSLVVVLEVLIDVVLLVLVRVAGRSNKSSADHRTTKVLPIVTVVVLV